jgi:hypothetical protein
MILISGYYVILETKYDIFLHSIKIDLELQQIYMYVTSRPSQ